MRLRDRVKTEAAVQRINWRLDWSIPSRRQREILRELRAHLADAAEANELAEALERLGDARDLAEAYADAESRRWRWRSGLIAALIAHLVMTILVLMASFAFTAGVNASLAGGGEFTLWPGLWFGDGMFTYHREAGTIGASITLISPLHLLVMALAFVAVSRPWRLLHRTEPDRAG